MSASKILAKSAKSAKPRPPTRFTPTPAVVATKYAPSDIDSDSTFSLTVDFERDEAGNVRAATFNLGGNCTHRVPLPDHIEGATRAGILGKTVVAVLAAELKLDMEKLERTYSFAYGITPLLYETDITFDTKADGTTKPVNGRRIRVTPLPACRACGFRVAGKPITSAHGIEGEIVAAHEKCCAAPFTFTVGEATFTCTPIRVDNKPRLGIMEDTGLMRMVNYFNYVRITDARALLDLSVDDTEPDDASSSCSGTAQDEDDMPIAKAAPKKRACPAACVAPGAKKPKQLDSRWTNSRRYLRAEPPASHASPHWSASTCSASA